MKRITLISCLLLSFATASAQSSAQPKTSVLKDVNGQAFRLTDYKGRVLLVNFWATWCAPCRTEIPDLIQLQRKYRKQGLRIVGLTYPPQKLSEVKRFVRALGINYRVALGTKANKLTLTPSGNLPVTVVIDREGVVRNVIEGIMYLDEFEEKVKPLLSHQR